MVNKELRKLLAEAEQQGWRVQRGRHVKLYAPDGVTVVTVAATPSDHRWLANTVSRMRKAGFKWPPQ